MGYSGFPHQSSAQVIIYTGNGALFGVYLLAFEMLVLSSRLEYVIYNIFQSDTFLHPPKHMSFENIREGKDLVTSSNLSNI